MHDVFISYQRGDREKVKHLSDELLHHGFTSWYDQELIPGQIWNTKITQHVLQCSILIVFLSRSALESHWVEYEVTLGRAAGKNILLLNLDGIDIDTVRDPFKVPTQCFDYVDSSSHGKIIESLTQMQGLPSRLWSILLARGVDICLPQEDFKKAKDGLVSDVEGVNLHSIKETLELQNLLLDKFGRLPYPLENREPELIEIRFLSERAGELSADRNYVVVGGPGGFPYVHHTLKNWTGYTDVLKTGYRFVTDPKRYFVPGPFLRQAEQGGFWGRGTPQLGIEDVQDGRPTAFFPVKEPSRAGLGTSYAIVYTKGFAKNEAPSHNKIIIVSSFSRAVTGRAINFICPSKVDERQSADEWLSKVRECGTHTETLLTFDNMGGNDLKPNLPIAPRTLGI